VTERQPVLFPEHRAARWLGSNLRGISSTPLDVLGASELDVRQLTFEHRLSHLYYRKLVVAAVAPVDRLLHVTFGVHRVPAATPLAKRPAAPSMILCTPAPSVSSIRTVYPKGACVNPNGGGASLRRGRVDGGAKVR
jgi:hypothetical protein